MMVREDYFGRMESRQEETPNPLKYPWSVFVVLKNSKDSAAFPEGAGVWGEGETKRIAFFNACAKIKHHFNLNRHMQPYYGKIS